VSERVCEACGGPLPTSHPNRRYCSEHCRRAQYDGVCVDCGARTDGHDGPGKASLRCVPCANRHSIEAGRADMKRVRLRRERIEELWAEGLLMRQIAAEMNWSMDHLAIELHRMRRAGYDLPYRRKVSRPLTR
jgi:hypothetical protein